MAPLDERNEVIDLTGEEQIGPSGNNDNIVADHTDADEDDEDLKLAIAMSLQDQTDIDCPPTTVATLAGKHPSSQRSMNVSTLQPHHTSSVVSKGTDNSSMSLLGLDRKQMEAERLARLKRKRETNPTESLLTPAFVTHSSQLRSDLVSTTETRVSALPPRQIPGIAVEPEDKTTKQDLKSSHPVSGKVFLTSEAASTSSQGVFMSFSELVKPPDPSLTLKSALLSSFVADFDWVLPHFDTKNVSFVFVLHAANSTHKANLEQDFEGIGNVRLVIPQTNGMFHVMHSKLILLFYENSTPISSDSQKKSTCRIAIPTANLTPYDWGVGKVMENMVFVIDLPEKSNPSHPGSTQSSSPEFEPVFERDLRQSLASINVPEAVLIKLRRYDFRQTADIAFIASSGGPHSFTAADVYPSSSHPRSKLKVAMEEPKIRSRLISSETRTGLFSLSDAVTSLGLAQAIKDDQSALKIDYITSSLGALKTRFMSNLYVSVCGQAMNYLGVLAGKSEPKNGVVSVNDIDHLAKQQITIYFPSDQTVRTSKGGPNSAGTICFNSASWNGTAKAQFPKQCMRDCVGSRADGILMHSKIIYVRFLRPKLLCFDNSICSSTNGDHHSEDVKSEPTRLYSGWIYVGSANLSESAWGTVVMDAKTKIPRINNRNYESGVMIPVPVSTSIQRRLKANSQTTLHDLTLQEVFGDMVPVPVQEPAESYADGRKPWFFNG